MGQSESRVTIQLKTVIHDEDAAEETEVEATGTLNQKNKLTVLKYKEEMEDFGTVDTFITIQPEKVSIKRTGVVAMHQQFRLKYPTENVYQHPHGNIHMETFTNEMNYTTLEKNQPGRLQLGYQVKLNGQNERKHTLDLVFTEEDTP